ncbi:MAG: 4Fe-4S binding protein [Muribaculaceae bacterium]|nr:4Fe-4S binding protein [Muribaculaceae bacterium]
MKSHSIRYLRIAVALVSLVLITLLFVDFTGYIAVKVAFLAKIQLIPALLAVNVTAIVILAALTLIFGRIYCSVICPLGILQDILAWVRRRFATGKKRRIGLYRFQPARNMLRNIFLTLALLLALIHMHLLDPYSAFGRIIGQGGVPLWRLSMSALGDAAAANGTYLFAGEVPGALQNFNIAVAVVAAVTFVTITVFAFMTGRGYCNTICPVGTVLGYVSRYSLLRPVIDTDKCTRCGSCGRKCKARCIDTKNHVIDYSRCVVCFDCINNCREGAISYRLRRSRPAVKPDTLIVSTSAAASKPDSGRRSFLVGTAIVAGTAAASAAGKVTDGGFAPVKQKRRHADAAPTVPPGAVSLAHFRSHCTACQLCVSECPNEVLRPSTSLDGFMQPVMTFTDGFCRQGCTRCGDVCPTGAIRPIQPEEKTAIKIGTAVVDCDSCISAAYGQSCGNCAVVCPAHAVKLVRADNGNLRPVVNESACIGCGSCEYHCPVGRAGMLSSSKAAIYVNGLQAHQNV